LAAALRGAGAHVLDPGSHVLSVDGVWVGVAGTTGAGGGFGTHGRLGMRGGASDKHALHQAGAAADGLDAALAAVGHCAVRIALMHYAPTVETLVGERPHIWPALGSDRLAAPIHKHRPDLVVHAHAHEGSPEGELGGVPVLNVSASVIGRPLKLIDLPGQRR
jgi:uncharacterized protein